MSARVFTICPLCLTTVRLAQLHSVAAGPMTHQIAWLQMNGRTWAILRDVARGARVLAARQRRPPHLSARLVAERDHEDLERAQVVLA